MNCAEVQAEYYRLKWQHEANLIPRNAFEDQVNAMRFLDGQGTIYQIDIEDGSWLRWDGTAWVPHGSKPGIVRSKPVDQASSPSSVGLYPAAGRQPAPVRQIQLQKAKRPPESLPGLLFLIIKSFIVNLPKTFLIQLIKLAAAFVLVILVHTWLVVVRNEGFNLDWANPFTSITNLPGSYRTVTLFWGFAAFFLTNVIMRLIKSPVQFFMEIASIPFDITSGIKQAGQAAPSAFLLPMGLTLVATLLIQGPYLILLYALIVFFSFIAREKGFFYHLFRLGWQDWQKLFHTAQSGKAANPGCVGLSVLGVSLGFLLSYFLPFKPYGAFLVLAMFIALIVLIRKKRIPPVAALWALSFLAFSAVVFSVRTVFADDGGWREAGGTFKLWAKSPGAGHALGTGIPPAVSAAGGALAGGMMPDIPFPGGGPSGAGGSGAGGPGGPGGAGGPGGSDGPNGSDNDADPGSEPGDPPGTTVQENPDGSITKYFPDGTVATKYPDGTIHVTTKDGESYTEYPDGTTSEKFKDGTYRNTFPDGTITGGLPDGTKFIKHPDGSMELDYPEGGLETITPDGFSTRRDPDGTVVTRTPEGVSTVTNPDGSFSREYTDGRFETGDKLGNSTTYDTNNNIVQQRNPAGSTKDFHGDGTYTVTDKNGNNVTCNSKGDTLSANIKSADGSTYVQDKDGNVTMTGPEGTYTEKADGTMNMNMKDGTRVTGNSHTGEITMGSPDGTVIHQTADGGVSGHLPDGRNFNFGADGKVSISDQNGNSVNVNPDGSGSYHDQDGTVITQGKDGTATIKTKDGTAWTAKPDGSASVQGANGAAATMHTDGSMTVKGIDGRTQTFSADQLKAMTAQAKGGL